MEPLDQIKARLAVAFPAAELTVIPNGSPGNPASLLVDGAHAFAVARWLQADPELQLDFASNVTGVDWPDKRLKEKVRVKRDYKGQEIEVDEDIEKVVPGYLEVVYHLYSMSRKHGPLVLRLRTRNRTDQVRLPSLTPIFRGAEFQEREVYDLFGVVFEGHPDLRRLLMWDTFTDHPMRKDYREPDDYEYEPTPHGAVFDKAQAHYPREHRHG